MSGLSPCPDLDAEALDALRRDGVVRLSGFLDPESACGARGALYAALEDAGVRRDGRWVGPRPVDEAAFWALQSPLQKRLKAAVARSGVLAALCPARVARTVETLLGGRSVVPFVDRPQLLFTVPSAGAWSVPHRHWHVDLPRLGDDACPGLQMFTFVDPVEPGGGGTLVAAGSHRYVNDRGRVRSKEVRRRLDAHPWFHALLHPEAADRDARLDGMQDGDAALRVVELTGSPGDVYLMDLRLLHAPAPNVADRPRLMATQRFVPADPGLAVFEDA